MGRRTKIALQASLLIVTALVVLASGSGSSGWVDSASLSGTGVMTPLNPQVTNNFLIRTTPATDGNSEQVNSSLSYVVTFTLNGTGTPEVLAAVSGEDVIRLNLGGGPQTVSVTSGTLLGQCIANEPCSGSLIAIVGSRPDFTGTIDVEWEATANVAIRRTELLPEGFSVTLERQ